MTSPGQAPQSLPQETESLLDRAHDVWYASKKNEETEGDEATLLEDSLNAVAHHAPLYFRFNIPPWPPHLLLRKVMRRVMMPFWSGQVHFNEASRDSLHSLSRRTDRQRQGLTAHEKRIEILEREIADLHVLLRKVAAPDVNSVPDTGAAVKPFR